MKIFEFRNFQRILQLAKSFRSSSNVHENVFLSNAKILEHKARLAELSKRVDRGPPGTLSVSRLVLHNEADGGHTKKNSPARSEPNNQEKEVEMDGELCSIARVIWDRPTRKNALTPALLLQLNDAIAQLEQSPPSAAIFAGWSGNFCSGLDLQMVASLAHHSDLELTGQHEENAQTEIRENGALIVEFGQWLANRIRALPCITMAHVEGAAMGGGAELALCCDLRSVESDAWLSLVHRQMHMSTGFAGLSNLRRLLSGNASLALQFFLESRRLTAPEMLRFGLANHVLSTPSPPPSVLSNENEQQEQQQKHRLDEAERWLANLIRGIPVSVIRQYKQLIMTSSLSSDWALQMSQERNTFLELWCRKETRRNIVKAEQRLRNKSSSSSSSLSSCSIKQ